ncbi:MAG: zinc ribbon domain-containing protein YjdM [Rickettsiaceae bacterium]|nr:zinc ribbon domain-containing protein YjdM [Rickettsiaceae bacterium]MDP4832811.1 zinc ribbon domain-containing protein YjdM [Rickettsiaceae bacterium]MDP5083756.1 zinc ribbon domain-containing protein YjdM [Rickettsiaceae bacterium]
MTNKIQACTKCGMTNIYSDGCFFICADCGDEQPLVKIEDPENNEAIIKDANGNVLASGDNVVLIKDLKVKGSSINLKGGTKIKNIRLVDGDHEVECKTNAGQFMLKACFLKKA